MNSSQVLTEAFGRIQETVHDVCAGLTQDQLAYRPDGDANSIAWLVWHLTRVQDDHLADLEGTEQIWTSADWANRFALPFDPTDTGFGHSSTDVGAVRGISAELLTGYLDDTVEQTRAIIGRHGDNDLDRIIDDSWDPPVTIGVRLVSVISDDLQHAGQAAFLRGLIERQ
ncbi:DinB family protein [Saxibacter everestensis]|uniref:DinB family protein n=1 Tax=Saxibacter everestensis TaxID=2909229 RepID=A0ABY8QUH3_9MICO|nr:DinB family protein [Brevibacteriaceae bacterium ZFBP1038]